MRQILLVEDTQSLQLVYKAVLRNSGFEALTASNAAEGAALFARHMPTTVVLDLMLPDRDGLDLMQEMLSARPETNVIVITANGSINRAVEAMRRGAYDFLVKPFDEQRFLGAVRNALNDARAARQEPGAPTSASARGFAGFIGSSPDMQEIYTRVRSVARSMATIFISGESGTGKEVCAQAVHDISARASGPFVPLNCGAIPSELLESEVFGHLKGSFTGAIADKPGAAAAADNGTLFLDEICEMDLNLQTKLLRFLQTSTIQPVGAARPRKVNVRIICATNRDPMEEVRRGRFREDLYYRLHVVPIHLPPLRDRGRDILEIAENALMRFSAEEGKVFHGLSPEVEDLFLRLPWPGNVRQLLNVIRNVVVLHDGPQVLVHMLPAEVQAMALQAGALAGGAGFVPGGAGLSGGIGGGGVSGGGGPSLRSLAGRTLAEIERLVIEDAIRRHDGSIPRAARELDVAPSTIYRKRDSWGGGPALQKRG